MIRVLLLTTVATMYCIKLYTGSNYLINETLEKRERKERERNVKKVNYLIGNFKKMNDLHSKRSKHDARQTTIIMKIFCTKLIYTSIL